jgi:uncharacterized protein (TIGR03083 family)
MPLFPRAYTCVVAGSSDAATPASLADYSPHMQLNPRYGDDEPVLRFDLDTEPPATAMLRQRDRLAATLATLDADQWAAPSRCDGWSTQDVIAHVVSTNQFWRFSIAAGLRHEPTTFLATFDPVATPAELVDAVREKSATETLDELVTSNEQLAAVVGELDGAAWDTVAEAPPGHLPIRLVVLHALWDGWVHERDISLPIGLPVVEEPDEITSALRYGTALGPAFLASRGSTRVGALELVGSGPDVRFVIDLGTAAVVHDGPAPDGAVTMRGNAVDLLEAVSYRTPLDPFLAVDDRWMLDGLAAAFEVDAGAGTGDDAGRGA